jgi:CrcB protein
MKMILYIGLGGFLGAIARYLLSGLTHRLYSGGTFPAGTLLVNVIGCLVIGALMSLIEDKGLFGPAVRMFFVIGFLGSFTTFSSFGYETVELLRDGQMLAAGLNILANFALGIGAVFLGWTVVRMITV